jgi:hypothetical protein
MSNHSWYSDVFTLILKHFLNRILISLILVVQVSSRSHFTAWIHRLLLIILNCILVSQSFRTFVSQITAHFQNSVCHFSYINSLIYEFLLVSYSLLVVCWNWNVGIKIYVYRIGDDALQMLFEVLLPPSIFKFWLYIRNWIVIWCESITSWTNMIFKCLFERVIAFKFSIVDQKSWTVKSFLIFINIHLNWLVYSARLHNLWWGNWLFLASWYLLGGFRIDWVLSSSQSMSHSIISEFLNVFNI